MDPRLRAFGEAAERAVQYQLRFAQHDGSFIWDPAIRDAYHKQAYSWSINGRIAEAHRLLTWMRTHTLQDDGSLRDYNGDVYKHSWLFQGCHRMGRFDVSHPVMRWMLRQQKDCGGLPHFAADERLRALATAWVGVSALYFGDIAAAERCAGWCTKLLDQPEEGRFYFQTTLDGELLTEAMAADAEYIDLERTGQAYWEIGLPWMLMGRLYQATGEQKWLGYAERFFDALADDFNTPAARAVLFEWVGEANRRLDAGERVGVGRLAEMLETIGLENLLAGEGEGEADTEAERLLDERQRARAERDFARADAIRDELAARGWQVRDTADGARLVRSA